MIIDGFFAFGYGIIGNGVFNSGFRGLWYLIIGFSITDHGVFDIFFNRCSNGDRKNEKSPNGQQAIFDSLFFELFIKIRTFVPVFFRSSRKYEHLFSYQKMGKFVRVSHFGEYPINKGVFYTLTR